MQNERPRKVYKLTNEGQNLLNFTEDSLNFICKKIGNTGMSKDDLAEGNIPQSTLRPLMRKMEHAKPLI
jgi:DNA-binding PadR family transcriptional regulator